MVPNHISSISGFELIWFAAINFWLTPDHNLSSPYTMSQTLETSADTGNMRRGVQRQNLQYNNIQEFF